MPVIDFSLPIRTVRELGLLKSVCTIKRPPTTTSDTGAASLDPADTETVTGLSDIACMLAPAKTSAKAAEQNRENYTEQRALFRCLLDGYFPQILQKDLALIDGEYYDIKNVDVSSQLAAAAVTFIDLEQMSI
jgi:hypothetical protein